MLGHPVLREIGWRPAHHPPHCAHADRAEARIRQVADTDADIDPFVHHVRDPVHKQRADIHLGVQVAILGEDRGDVLLPEQRRCGNRENAARLGIGAGGSGLGLGHIGEDPAAVVEIARARFGQLHHAGGAGEQPRADVILERGHGAGDRGRAHVELPRRFGKAAGFGHLHKHLHRMKPRHHYRSHGEITPLLGDNCVPRNSDLHPSKVPIATASAHLVARRMARLPPALAKGRDHETLCSPHFRPRPPRPAVPVADRCRCRNRRGRPRQG